MRERWSPVAYRVRPTADGRRIAADAEVSLRRHAPVLLQPPKFPHMTVVVGHATELLEWLDDQIWLKFEFNPNAGDLPPGRWYPAVDIAPDFEVEETVDGLWFKKFHITAVTLGRNPVWTAVPPITPM
jgi:hypothetical protein